MDGLHPGAVVKSLAPETGLNRDGTDAGATRGFTWLTAPTQGRSGRASRWVLSRHGRWVGFGAQPRAYGCGREAPVDEAGGAVDRQPGRRACFTCRVLV